MDFSEVSDLDEIIRELPRQWQEWLKQRSKYIQELGHLDDFIKNKVRAVGMFCVASGLITGLVSTLAPFTVGLSHTVGMAIGTAIGMAIGTSVYVGSGFFERLIESDTWQTVKELVKIDNSRTASLREKLNSVKKLINSSQMRSILQSEHFLVGFKDGQLKISNRTKAILWDILRNSSGSGSGVTDIPILTHTSFEEIHNIEAIIDIEQIKDMSTFIEAVELSDSAFGTYVQVAGRLTAIAQSLQQEMKTFDRSMKTFLRDYADDELEDMQIEVERPLEQMALSADGDSASLVTNTELIDSNGGQLHLNNVTLVVPKDALHTQEHIKVTTNMNGQYKVKLAGLHNFMRSKLHVELTPHGLQFRKPVLLQIKKIDWSVQNYVLLVFHKHVKQGKQTLWTDITSECSPQTTKDTLSLTINHFSLLEIFVLFLPLAFVGVGVAAFYYKRLAVGLLNGQNDACNFYVYYKSTDGSLSIFIETQKSDDNDSRHEIPKGYQHVGQSSSRYSLFDKENLLFFFDTSTESQAAFILKLKQCKTAWQKVQVPLSVRNTEKLPKYIEIRRRLPAPHLAELVREEKLCKILLLSQERVLEIKKEGTSYINEIFTQLSQGRIISIDEERNLSEMINNTSQPNVRLDINITEKPGATAQGDDSMKAEYFISISSRELPGSSLFRHQGLGRSGPQFPSPESMKDQLKRLEKYVQIGGSTRDKYITQCYEMLVVHMRTKKLLPRLVARDVIDLEEKNTITGSGTGEKIEKRQNDELVEIIRKLDNEKYLIFLQVLAGVQEDLVQRLTDGNWYPPISS